MLSNTQSVSSFSSPFFSFKKKKMYSLLKIQWQAGGRDRMCELHLICLVTSQDSLFSLCLWGNKSRDTAWPLTGFIQLLYDCVMDGPGEFNNFPNIAFIPAHSLLSKVGPCVFMLKGLFFLHKWRKDPFPPASLCFAHKSFCVFSPLDSSSETLFQQDFFFFF